MKKRPEEKAPLSQYLLYLGCTVPVRALQYEISARKVAERLGIQFVDIPGFSCCGYPIKSVNHYAYLLMAARNLALAYKRGLSVCTLCSSCGGSLAEAAHEIEGDKGLRKRINEDLSAELGLHYEGKVPVLHFTRVLQQAAGSRRIAEQVKVDLSSLRFAPHYGCHYTKPSVRFNKADDPENPRSLDELIEATGAQSIPYEDKLACCGGGVLAIDEQIALAIAQRKLEHVRTQQADAMVLICPFCSIMYESNQRKIEKGFETYDLFAPVQLAEGVSVYRKIDHPEEVDLTHPNPQKPAKDLFFPQSEVMFDYEKVGKQNQIHSKEEVTRDRILFGTRPCDIGAISIIEKVFVGKEYTDVYFLEKRKKTTIVGLGCNQPLSTCFCSSAGEDPFLRAGSDLFFVDLGEAYFVELLTENGMAFRNNKFFEKVEPKDLAAVKGLEKKVFEKVGFPIPVDGIDKRLDLMGESSFWDRVHEKCVGCRICTYLCPTCHCFDIVDEASQDKGKRVRHWDSCLSPLYSLETSGHNPRPTTRERTRQRLMHKFNYYPKVFGEVACVGCGRCIIYCPVHFDIRQVILRTSSKRPKRVAGERI